MACGDVCPLLSQILSAQKIFRFHDFRGAWHPRAFGLSHFVRRSVPLFGSPLVALGRKDDRGRDEILDA